MADTTLFGARTPKEVLELCRANGIKMVDVRFVDLPGTWQHFTIPVGELSDDVFEEGLGFDGSSIRGFKQIHEFGHAAAARPDHRLCGPGPARADPRASSATCSTRSSGDSLRARPAPDRPARRGVSAPDRASRPTSYWGPEAEFYIFNSLRFDQTANSGYYFIDSEEGIWNSGATAANLAYRPRYKEGYFPVPPTDKFQDLRSEIVLALQAAGIRVEVQHHEVGTAGPGRDRHALRHAGRAWPTR